MYLYFKTSQEYFGVTHCWHNIDGVSGVCVFLSSKRVGEYGRYRATHVFLPQSDYGDFDWLTLEQHEARNGGTNGKD